MNSSNSSKYGWRILSPQRLRLMPRGNSTTLIEVPFDTGNGPVSPEVSEVVRQEIAQQLAGELPTHPDVIRFLHLRDQAAAAEKDVATAELEAQRFDLDRRRLALEPHSADKARRLQQLNGEHASAIHTHASACALRDLMAKELEAARPPAERAVRAAIGRASSEAITRCVKRVAEAAAAVAEAAGPALDALAVQLWCLSFCCRPVDALWFSFADVLPQLAAPNTTPTLAPAAAPAEAAPLPTVGTAHVSAGVDAGAACVVTAPVDGIPHPFVHTTCDPPPAAAPATAGPDDPAYELAKHSRPAQPDTLLSATPLPPVAARSTPPPDTPAEEPAAAAAEGPPFAEPPPARATRRRGRGE